MKGQRRAMEFERQWGDLARYNAEKARGVLHDEATDRRMAVKQEAYDAWSADDMRQQGYRLVDGSGPLRVWEKAPREPWYRRLFGHRA